MARQEVHIFCQLDGVGLRCVCFLPSVCLVCLCRSGLSDSSECVASGATLCPCLCRCEQDRTNSRMSRCSERATATLRMIVVQDSWTATLSAQKRRRRVSSSSTSTSTRRAVWQEVASSSALCAGFVPYRTMRLSSEFIDFRYYSLTQFHTQLFLVLVLSYAPGHFLVCPYLQNRDAR